MSPSHPELPTVPTPPRPSWIEELEALLRRAAALAIRNDIDSDVFMRAAWSALLDAHPGLRAELEDKQLRQQLEQLRARGKLPTA